MQKIISTILFILLFSTIAFSRIEKVTLIYDKNEVYHGNTFKIKLSVQTSFGKFHISNSSSKYDFSQFEFSIPDCFKFISITNSYLTLRVKDKTNIEKAELTYYYIFNKKLKFNSVIPIVFKDTEIKSIRIVKNSLIIQANSNINLGIVAQIGTSKIVNVSKKGKISYYDFKYTILRGGQVLDKFGNIKINGNNFCDSILKVKVEYIDNPEIFSIKEYKIESYSKRINLSYKNMSGNDLSIKLDVIYNNCFLDSLLRVEIYENTDKVFATYFLPLKDEIIILDVVVEDGIKGKNGSNGYYKSIDGENGGDGTDGSDGADVFVFYTKPAERFLSKLIISSEGGRGGRYGKGGKSGRLTVCSHEIERTVYGNSGINGRDGLDGRKGTISYIFVAN